MHLRTAFNSYAGHIRVTWPRSEDDQGLFYQLTLKELAFLKKRQTSSEDGDAIYTAVLRFEPGALPFGTGRADVRINQVRLWLVGVKVNEDPAHRRRLMVNITHTGDETFPDTSRQKLEFAHDTVNIQFEYDTAKVKTSNDFTSKVVFSRQGIENNWSGGDTKPTESAIAAIGPFTTWNIVIRESVNPGLQMDEISEAWVESWGANRPF